MSEGVVHLVPVGRARLTSCGKFLPRWCFEVVRGERATRELAEVTCPRCRRAAEGA